MRRRGSGAAAAAAARQRQRQRGGGGGGGSGKGSGSGSGSAAAAAAADPRQRKRQRQRSRQQCWHLAAVRRPNGGPDGRAGPSLLPCSAAGRRPAGSNLRKTSVPKGVPEPAHRPPSSGQAGCRERGAPRARAAAAETGRDGGTVTAIARAAAQARRGCTLDV